MATIKIIFHGTQVPNGDPLIYTQMSAKGTREELTKAMADSMDKPGCIVFSADNTSTIVNKNHIAMIEVFD